MAAKVFVPKVITLRGGLNCYQILELGYTGGPRFMYAR